MKCEEAQNKLSSFFDWPEDCQEKIEVEAHLLECEECAEQFSFWEDSEELIREYSNEEEAFELANDVNRNVMDRIYKEQYWLLPVSNKSYHFSKSFRRNMAIMIAACMAMFTCALFVFLFDYRDNHSQEQLQQLTGLIDTANVSGESAVLATGLYAEVPVASISDPFVLQVVPSFPQYYVALSLLGLVMALLLLNWFSRTRN